ncbi:MAG: alcohol dehydrogenase catalytic domain-containing protein [Bacteroidales bacterium]|nr:alcohol dehydrogenase catalytic domain-containing protein [Bacteroidales bacterium]MCF8391785.1 alcohol dehydrogenase catalytic domain-containing protein [Bacteroidales bacterium]
MKAAVLNKYGSFIIEERLKPQTKDDEVLIKVKFASICGTDQHIFKGEFHPRTKLPFIPGHEFSGRIEFVGKNVSGFKVGEKVAVDPIIPCGECQACKRNHYPACVSLKLIGIDLDGGFTEYLNVKPEMIYKVPEQVKDEHAALIEILSIGFHASKRAQVGKDDSIAIWGAGKVGQSILYASKTISSGKIFVVDIIEERLQMVKSVFPDVEVINALHTNPVNRIKERTGNNGVDIAFEAVGHATHIPERYNPVRSCINAIRGGGKICVLGLSDEPAEILMKEMIWKEAILVTSRVSHGEYQDSINALAEGKLNPDKMISAVMDIDDVQNAFALLENHPDKHLKILLKISE